MTTPRPDPTRNERQRKSRAERRAWLQRHARGLSAEGLLGALMRGECKLIWTEPEPKKKGKTK